MRLSFWAIGQLFSDFHRVRSVHLDELSWILWVYFFLSRSFQKDWGGFSVTFTEYFFLKFCCRDVSRISLDLTCCYTAPLPLGPTTQPPTGFLFYFVFPFFFASTEFFFHNSAGTGDGLFSFIHRPKQMKTSERRRGHNVTKKQTNKQTNKRSTTGNLDEEKKEIKKAIRRTEKTNHHLQ